jgi:uncharacterized membrane protein
MTRQKLPVIREDDNELLGFVLQDSAGWQAQTIFGYGIDRAFDKDAAEAIVREKGLNYLTGVWQYFDLDEQTWYPCVLKEVYEHQVTVIRTNFMGHQDSDEYKVLTIKNPSETTLAKS